MKITLLLMGLNLKRAILCKSFVLSTIGTALLILSGSSAAIFYQDFDGNWEIGGDILYGLTTGMQGSSGTPFAIVGILPLFVFSTTFAMEWQQRAINFWIIRVGTTKYAICKIIATAISAMLVTIVGFLLYGLILSFWLPLFSTFQTGNPFEPFLLAGRPMMYFIYFTLYFALGSALCAVCGLGVSTMIPDKFTTIASPLVIYIIMVRLTSSPTIPEYLQAINLVEGIYSGSTPFTTLFVKFVVILVLCSLMGVGIVGNIKRRLNNA